LAKNSKPFFYIKKEKGFNDFSLRPLRLCGKSFLSLGTLFTAEAQRTQRGILKGCVAFFFAISDCTFRVKNVKLEDMKIAWRAQNRIVFKKFTFFIVFVSLRVNVFYLLAIKDAIMFFMYIIIN